MCVLSLCSIFGWLNFPFPLFASINIYYVFIWLTVCFLRRHLFVHDFVVWFVASSFDFYRLDSFEIVFWHTFSFYCCSLELTASEVTASLSEFIAHCTLHFLLRREISRLACTVKSHICGLRRKTSFKFLKRVNIPGTFWT
jgi:hypothetical protein